MTTVTLKYLTPERVVQFGYYKTAKVRATIDITMDPMRFTMSGEITRNRSFQTGGQCIDDIAALYSDNDAVVRLCQLWRRWHLNNMRPGCEHQRASERVYEVSEPCEVCDYRYGSAWLHEDMPAEALAEVQSLIAVLSAKNWQAAL